MNDTNVETKKEMGNLDLVAMLRDIFWTSDSRENEITDPVLKEAFAKTSLNTEKLAKATSQVNAGPKSLKRKHGENFKVKDTTLSKSNNMNRHISLEIDEKE